jgi:hypothetical protein
MAAVVALNKFGFKLLFAVKSILRDTGYAKMYVANSHSLSFKGEYNIEKNRLTKKLNTFTLQEGARVFKNGA